MKTHRGVAYSPHFHYLGTSCKFLVNLTPRPLIPQRTNPDAHSVGGWVSPGTGLHIQVCFQHPPNLPSNAVCCHVLLLFVTHC
jgi:hypothetical protein